MRSRMTVTLPLRLQSSSRTPLLFLLMFTFLILPSSLAAHFSSGDENVFGLELEPCSTEGMAITGLERDGRCAHLEFDSRSHPICIDIPTFPTYDKPPNDEVEEYEDELGEDIDDQFMHDDDDDDQAPKEDEAHFRRDLSLFSFLFGGGKKNSKRQQSASDSTHHPGKENFFTLTGQPNWMLEHMPCTDEPERQCPIQHWCVNERAFAFFIERAGGCDKIGNIVCSATNMAVLEAYKDALKNSHGGEKAGAALECLQSKCWI